MKEYIVGIDFGHGETAAWVVPISRLNDEGKALHLNNDPDANLRQIPSVVYFNNAGRYSLKSEPGLAVKVGLKNRISKLSQIEKRHYQNFIRLVVKLLLDSNDILKIENGEPNFILCMASPTQWNEEEKSEYLDFFNKAISCYKLHFEWIINESDAAYFTHSEGNEDKCTLVVDYGSSTIDYTAIRAGRKISKDEWSNPQLGASQIEKIMMDESIELGEYDDIDAMYAETVGRLHQNSLGHIAPKPYVLLNLRNKKEEVYRSRDDYFDCLFTFKKPTGLQEFGRPIYSFSGNLSQILPAYVEAVKADLKELKKNLSAVNGKDPDRIILSGGASIMMWFNRLVHELFPHAEIIADYNPSYVVAKGIALYARKQLDAMQKFFDSLKNIDYAGMYKNADLTATKTAVEKTISEPVDKVKNSAPIDGYDIRRIFCDFIKGMNSSNYTFSRLVQDNVDSYINSQVTASLKTAIKSVFNVDLTPKNVNIHIPVSILKWEDNGFVPGGAFYGGITQAIKDSSSRWDFSWDVKRDCSEASGLANGVKNRILAIDWSEAIDYPASVLESEGNNIKQQTLQVAQRIFFENQLFELTFK